MGNTNVQLEAPQTRDMSAFLRAEEKNRELVKTIQEENNKLIELHNQVKVELETPRRRFLDVAFESIIESEQVCNKPKVVFWLSKSAREKCKESRREIYNNVMNIGKELATFNEKNNYSMRLASQIRGNEHFLQVNSKYL